MSEEMRRRRELRRRFLERLYEQSEAENQHLKLDLAVMNYIHGRSGDAPVSFEGPFGHARSWRLPR